MVTHKLDAHPPAQAALSAVHNSISAYVAKERGITFRGLILIDLPKPDLKKVLIKNFDVANFSIHPQGV